MQPGTRHGPPVKTNPTDTVHPLPGSSNTGELKAIIELFDYLLYYSPFSETDQLTIYTDSQYVISILQGDALPVTHHQLVPVAQKYYTAIRCKYRTTLLKVSSHIGIPGNELADTLAKCGVYSRSDIGRFSLHHTQSPSPPNVDFNHSQWTETPPLNKTISFRSSSPLTFLSFLFSLGPRKNLGSPRILLRKLMRSSVLLLLILPHSNRRVNKLKRQREKTRKILSRVISFLTFMVAPFSNGRTLGKFGLTLRHAPQVLIVKVNWSPPPIELKPLRIISPTRFGSRPRIPLFQSQPLSPHWILLTPLLPCKTLDNALRKLKPPQSPRSE